MPLLVMQRPPIAFAASINTKRRLAAATRRAAAMPAAPAPTIATSTSPDAAGAPSAGLATAAAVDARNERRVIIMVWVRALFRGNLPERLWLRKSGPYIEPFASTEAFS